MIYTITMVATAERLFIQNLSAEASPTNNFRYIKVLVFKHHNSTSTPREGLLAKTGSDVDTVKTDALRLKQTQVETVQKLLSWEDGVGSWRLNKTEDVKRPIDESMTTLAENRLIEMHKHKTQTVDLTIGGAYNKNKLCGHIEYHGTIMIRPGYGGCGKSYTCKSMETQRRKVLVVRRTTKLANNYNDDAAQPTSY